MKQKNINIAMVMDFYELTMSNGYFLDQDVDKDQLVSFDVFYRKNPDGGGFAIFTGLSQIIDYIKNLHFEKEDVNYLRSLGILSDAFLDYLENFKFRGSLYSFPEGTIIYPNEPVITVVAPLIDAQLIETELLLQINHQSLICTKARRIVKSANGRPVSDFGARRAHNNDAAVYGARAAYIGGFASTATVEAGKLFHIPVSGTMAHSNIMFYKDEFTAFSKYAKTYPDATVLLVDTYDVLKSGVPNAIRIQKEVLDPMGKKLKAVRLDSGDLAYLSKETRKMLDAAGLDYVQIIATNSLDEFTIRSLNQQDAKIDSYGVGERMITAKSEPVFGAVYKLASVCENEKFEPRIKISENVEKITNPGLKQVYRIYDENGIAIADLLAKREEEVDLSKPFRYVDPKKPWKNRRFENCRAVPLQVEVFHDGKLVYEDPCTEDIRNFVKHQLDSEIWDEEQRFENPHEHYMDMTPGMYEMKMSMLYEERDD